jgi:predicted hydrocarbon binding protein
MKRTRAIGFTDSVHDVDYDDKKEFLNFLMENSINWVTSEKKLDTFIKISDNQSCKCLSAGHTVHE